MPKTNSISLSKLTRHMAVSVRANTGADGKTTYSLSASSEAPVERWGYVSNGRWLEVLDHSPEAIDMSRADGMPLLLDHDMTDQVGLVESLALDPAARKLNCEVRFSRATRAAEVEQDVADGIRKNVSIGYQVREYMLDGEAEDGTPIYRATKWAPLEVSIVSIPADSTVGVGRSGEQTFNVRVIDPNKEEETPAEDAAEQAAGVTEADEAADAAQGNQAGATEGAAAEEASESTSEEAAEMAGTTGADAEATSSQEKDEGAEAADSTKQRSAVVVEDRSKSAVEIVQLATAHGLASRAADFLQRGLTVDQAAKEILELSRSKPIHSTSAERTMELSQNDQKNYSYARAIRVALGDEKGGLEAEIHQEYERSLPVGAKTRGGIFVPMSLSGRALDSKTNNAGGSTVFNQPGELIELLYNKAVVLQLGARMYEGLTGPVAFPKITGGAQAHWVMENSGTDVDESNISTGSVPLTPKTLQATTAFSRQLLNQSVIGIEAAVREDIAKAHALAIDKAALHGDGVTAPLGIYNTAGVNVVDMKDGVNYGKLVDMVAEVLAGNALVDNMGFATTARMAGKLAQTLVAQAAGAGFIWNGSLSDGLMAGYKALASNQVSSALGTGHDEHGIIFGNFQDLIIGGWGAMELVVDPYALKKQGLIELTSFQMADVAVRHGQSFTVAKGAKL